LSNIVNPTFEFYIADIPNSKSRSDEDGFGITSTGGSVLNDRLRKFEKETHYIKVFWDKGEFLLTKEGIEQCKKLDPSLT